MKGNRASPMPNPVPWPNFLATSMEITMAATMLTMGMSARMNHTMSRPAICVRT
jgi:hypothetical protein